VPILEEGTPEDMLSEQDGVPPCIRDTVYVLPIATTLLEHVGSITAAVATVTFDLPKNLLTETEYKHTLKTTSRSLIDKSQIRSYNLHLIFVLMSYSS
jgi:hypothetical protein